MTVKLTICLGYGFYVNITLENVLFKYQARRKLINEFGQKWYDQIWFFDMKRM